MATAREGSFSPSFRGEEEEEEEDGVCRGRGWLSGGRREDSGFVDEALVGLEMKDLKEAIASIRSMVVPGRGVALDLQGLGVGVDTAEAFDLNLNPCNSNAKVSASAS